MSEQTDRATDLNPKEWLQQSSAAQGVAGWAQAAWRWAVETFSPTDALSSDDKVLKFTDPSRLIGKGRVILLLFVIVVFGWGGFAPLESALTAPGVVVVESHRKAIQHLEGGIVRDILVKDGQHVAAGQVLLRLDRTQAKASLALLEGEADALAAQEARLIAERNGSATITFPDDLLNRRSDPKTAEAIRGESNTFDARQKSLEQEIAILSQRSGENGTIIAGLRKQQTAVEQQMALIQKETDNVEKLYKEGLTPLPRLLALQRQTADLNGQRGQIVEKISQTELSTGENRLQIENVKNQHMNDVLKDLRDVQTRRFDLMDRLHAARDVLNRLTVTAPVTGKIVSLDVHTIGAVVRPGDTLMEIVPENDKLEVEVRVRPQDAEYVHAGMSARVNLSSYETRRLPIVTGTVSLVSADQIVDQRSGQAYFDVRVLVDRTPLKKYPDARLMPGLPVEVSLLTGSRTALEYLMEPITDVLRRGMKEK